MNAYTTLVGCLISFLSLLLNSPYSLEAKEGFFHMSTTLHYFQNQDPQLFRFWFQLSLTQQMYLTKQLEKIDLLTLAQQKALVQTPQTKEHPAAEPFEEFSFSGNEEDKKQGQELIKEGRLGCLVLAGGQGTRLNFNGPKGFYPISVVKHKTLFQLLAEKIAAASHWAGCLLSLAVMTSPENDQETRDFFQTHNYFGLAPSQVYFFVQTTLPMLDMNGQLFLEAPDRIASGADGNGNCLLEFVHSGIWAEWSAKGIEYVNVVLVDNPLADPFDAELVGFHARQQVEITLKCTEKQYPEERVGAIVKEGERYGVIEYSELSHEEKMARRPNGKLKYCCANLSLFCFSMSFMKRMAEEHNYLPLHKAWKAARYVNEQGITQKSIEPMAWKYETFIFDWLAYTQQVAALLYPREQCFAPLKNAKGIESPQTVKEALQQYERKMIEVITGLQAPEVSFELAAEFYYPTQALLDKWKGKNIVEGYIEP